MKKILLASFQPRWLPLCRQASTAVLTPRYPGHAPVRNLQDFPSGLQLAVRSFNDFDGEFTYDADNPENSSVSVTIDTSSVDSNHAERDKHLRSEDFLYVSEFPEATFKSKRVVVDEAGEADIIGDLTLRGVTRKSP